ncbi:MAG: inositol monophosphatase [Chloroflexi bacterium]|nr:inositol monophosphatase [Chloroflexota bacterium]
MTPGLPISTSGHSPLDVARQCSGAAAELIRDAYGRVGATRIKGRGNVVTETDLAVEAAVLAILGREYPAHAVLSEETAATTRSDGWLWICDPIDGTKNFSRAIPHFAFSIALCFDCEPVVALTYHPLLDEEFAAVADGGATWNRRAMAVSDCATIREGMVAIDLGYDDRRGARQLDLARALWPGMQGLRVAGSAALGFAYLAAGRWDIFLHSKLEPWDVAAGLLLVREAGGIVSDRDGGPATIFSEATVAATPAVHSDFLRLAGEMPWRG